MHPLQLSVRARTDGGNLPRTYSRHLDNGSNRVISVHPFHHTTKKEKQKPLNTQKIWGWFLVNIPFHHTTKSKNHSTLKIWGWILLKTINIQILQTALPHQTWNEGT
jgi:hypothetical protein